MIDIVERLRGGWNHDRNPEADMVEAADRIAELEHEAAAAKAREKVLRDALELLWDSEGSPDINSLVAINAARELPADDTALRAALKAERERCISIIERVIEDERGRIYANDAVADIRALEDE